ncbi:MAG: succinyldiaminopimelate transaminase [Proteobacteria bacterium]|nr:succinyldiaminopimelate transaminase [Pseudomonadota bacterium]
MMIRTNPLLDRLRRYPQQALYERKAAMIQKGIEVLDFGVGDPIDPTPDFIRKSLCDAVEPKCGYPQVKGSEDIRRAICGYLHRRLGITVDPNTQVLPLSGAKEGVFHMPMVVIDPNAADRTVLFPDPGYSVYHRGALFAGAESVPIELTGDHQFRPWELPLDLLKRTRLLWLNTPHNPSGAVMPLEALQKTADLCRKHNILCVSDETYLDIYQSDPPHSLLECGFENVLVIHSLSKRSGMTGYRSGFVAGDARWIERLLLFRANPGVVPQTFVNAAAQAAWSDDAHVEERCGIFRQKKQIFTEFFDEMGWDYCGKEASFYLWLKTSDGISGAELALRLLDVGVLVSPGEMFSVAGGGSNYVRIALAPDLNSCTEAIRRWKQL